MSQRGSISGRLQLLLVNVILCAFAPASFAQEQQYGWVQIASVTGVNTSVKYLTFTDTLHGWMAENLASVRYTRDGGYTWMSSAVEGGMMPSQISMIDTVSGWAACLAAPSASRLYGSILKTTDGGATWRQALYLMDNGFKGTAHTTTLGNVSTGYHERFPSSFPASPQSVIDTGKVYRTEDAGGSWNIQRYADSITSLGRVQFVDSLHGWIAASGPKLNGILRTTNGGQNWQFHDTKLSVSRFSFADTNHGWASTGDQIYRTIDGGVSWDSLVCWCSGAEELKIMELAFTDTLNGWAIGYMFYQGDTHGAIYRTTDGGITWHQEYLGLTPEFYSGFMLDRHHGWAAGSQGVVFSYMPVTSVVQRMPDVPAGVHLRQNFPNPFNPTTTIEYELDRKMPVRLTLWDVMGREIRELVNAEQEPGVYQITVDGSRLASGVYYYIMRAGAAYSETRSMALIR